MTAAHFEDHPTDPNKAILRKPSRESSWVGLTEDEAIELLPAGDWEIESTLEFAQAIEAKLRERNT
jgi:hypothetical protein